ncbi:uncharacterized protein [Venturia canescens]|uniref:uncharacterized protein n=1 Tax=Venturia canescens TaxID=32260 RepID=UPI001C9D3A19|nr:uncharacterized protein LOC122408893 [Venturia canescens]
MAGVINSYYHSLVAELVETRRREVSRIVFGPPMPERRRGTTSSKMLEFVVLSLRYEFIAYIEDEAEYRRYSKCSSLDDLGCPWGTWDFDAGFIRWMFEGRWGQVHPESDWDHPAWDHPLGVLSAYDVD